MSLKRRKIELLAPAKNEEIGIEAIRHGADAVYIGASAFGARINAKNSIKDIKKLIDFAHLFNVKVYVTLNTILDDNELEQCKKIIWELYKIKTDAIIIQDFGILNLSLNNELPPIALHASTQCDIRTLDKVKFFEELGLKRVILARELSLDEINKISNATNIRLEYFIHGALCVCYSGQCYMSYYIGRNSQKRSANRGNCAQACRKKYSLVDDKNRYIVKNKYLLSLKDNNLSSNLDELIKAGITSFKIEGRLNDENYVKNITLYYHNLLKKYPRQARGEIISAFEPNPNKTFNRSYTNDYLFSKKDNIYNFITPKSIGEFIGFVKNYCDNYFILDTKLKINPQDGLCFINNDNLEGCLVNKTEQLKNGVKIYPNKKISLKKGDKIYRNIDIEFNKILENSSTKRKLLIDFFIYEDKIEVLDEYDNKISFDIDNAEFAHDFEKAKENYIKSFNKTQDTPYSAKNIYIKTDKLIFMPVSKINEIRRKILDLLSEKILSKYKTKTQKPIDIAQFPLDSGDYRLNIHNKKSQEFYELCNCKVKEKSFESLKKHKNKEIMRTKHCLKRAFLGCSAKDKLFLEDENKVRYPLNFDCKNCEMAILTPEK